MPSERIHTARSTIWNPASAAVEPSVARRATRRTWRRRRTARSTAPTSSRIPRPAQQHRHAHQRQERDDREPRHQNRTPHVDAGRRPRRRGTRGRSCARSPIWILPPARSRAPVHEAARCRSRCRRGTARRTRTRVNAASRLARASRATPRSTLSTYQPFAKRRWIGASRTRSATQSILPEAYTNHASDRPSAATATAMATSTALRQPGGALRGAARRPAPGTVASRPSDVEFSERPAADRADGQQRPAAAS